MNPTVKDDIIEFAKRKRDTANSTEHPFYAAIYFVLRNRTEENWGPKELTMADAIKMDTPSVSNADVAEGCEPFIGVPRSPTGFTVIDGKKDAP